MRNDIRIKIKLKNNRIFRIISLSVVFCMVFNNVAFSLQVRGNTYTLSPTSGFDPIQVPDENNPSAGLPDGIGSNFKRNVQSDLVEQLIKKLLKITGKTHLIVDKGVRNLFGMVHAENAAFDTGKMRVEENGRTIIVPCRLKDGRVIDTRFSLAGDKGTKNIIRMTAGHEGDIVKEQSDNGGPIGQYDEGSCLALIKKGNEWITTELSGKQHEKVINKVLKKFFSNEYRIKEPLLLNPIRHMLGQSETGAERLDINVFSIPEKEMYEDIYKAAKKEKVLLPERGNFLLLSHVIPGRVKNNKPRSVNIFIPRNFLMYLEYVAEKNNGIFGEWLRHETARIISRLSGNKLSEKDIVKEYPLDLLSEKYSEYIDTMGRLIGSFMGGKNGRENLPRDLSETKEIKGISDKGKRYTFSEEKIENYWKIQTGFMNKVPGKRLNIYLMKGGEELGRKEWLNMTEERKIKKKMIKAATIYSDVENGNFLDFNIRDGDFVCKRTGNGGFDVKLTTMNFVKNTEKRGAEAGAEFLAFLLTHQEKNTRGDSEKMDVFTSEEVFKGVLDGLIKKNIWKKMQAFHTMETWISVLVSADFMKTLAGEYPDDAENIAKTSGEFLKDLKIKIKAGEIAMEINKAYADAKIRGVAFYSANINNAIFDPVCFAKLYAVKYEHVTEESARVFDEVINDIGQEEYRDIFWGVYTDYIHYISCNENMFSSFHWYIRNTGPEGLKDKMRFIQPETRPLYKDLLKINPDIMEYMNKEINFIPEEEIDDYKAAILLVNRWIRNNKRIDLTPVSFIDHVRELHTVASRSNPKIPRKNGMSLFRRITPDSTGRPLIFPDPEYARVMMQSLALEVTKPEFKSMHPIMQAAKIYYELVNIHIFDDANERVARLIMDYYLMRNGYHHLKITPKNRGEFIKVVRFMKRPEDFASLLTNALFEQRIELHLRAKMQKHLVAPDVTLRYHVKISPDSKGVYDNMINEMNKVIADRESPVILTSAGKTMMYFYGNEVVKRAKLARDDPGFIDLSRVTFVLTDEFRGSDKRTRDFNERFVDKLPKDNRPAKIISFNGTASNIYDVLDQYWSRLRGVGRIDLVLLAVGVNGHLAYNEPGTSLDSHVRIAQLYRSTKEHRKISFMEAYTVGMNEILKSDKIIVIATSDHEVPASEHERYFTKRKAIKRAILTPDVMASFVRMRNGPDFQFFIDKNIAGEDLVSMQEKLMNKEKERSSGGGEAPSEACIKKEPEEMTVDPSRKVREYISNENYFYSLLPADKRQRMVSRIMSLENAMIDTGNGTKTPFFKYIDSLLAEYGLKKRIKHIYVFGSYLYSDNPKDIDVGIGLDASGAEDMVSDHASALFTKEAFNKHPRKIIFSDGSRGNGITVNFTLTNRFFSDGGKNDEYYSQIYHKSGVVIFGNRIHSKDISGDVFKEEAFSQIRSLVTSIESEQLSWRKKLHRLLHILLIFKKIGLQNESMLPSAEEIYAYYEKYSNMSGDRHAKTLELIKDLENYLEGIKNGKKEEHSILLDFLLERLSKIAYVNDENRKTVTLQKEAMDTLYKFVGIGNKNALYYLHGFAASLNRNILTYLDSLGVSHDALKIKMMSDSNKDRVEVKEVQRALSMSKRTNKAVVQDLFNKIVWRLVLMPADKKIIIGLDTSWIPYADDIERKSVQDLLMAIKDLETTGRIVVIRENGQKLVGELKTASGGKYSNVIVIGGIKNVKEKLFEGLCDIDPATEKEEKALVVGVDPEKLETTVEGEYYYNRLVEILICAIKISMKSYTADELKEYGIIAEKLTGYNTNTWCFIPLPEVQKYDINGIIGKYALLAKFVDTRA